jgi:hypothetical protein
MSNSYQNTLDLAGALIIGISMSRCASHDPSADFICLEWLERCINTH